MKTREVTLPVLALIAGTRVALGIGLGLLFSDFLPVERRRAAGWSLLAVGVLTTIPLGAQILGSSRPRLHEERTRPRRRRPLEAASRG